MLASQVPSATSLHTDAEGFLSFAAVSDTSADPPTGRPQELTWFYRLLRDLGLSRVFNLGPLGVPADQYPHVPGIVTYINARWRALDGPAAPPPRSDLILLPPIVPIIHGASGRSLPLAIDYGGRATPVSRLTRLGVSPHAPAILLIGGVRAPTKDPPALPLLGGGVAINSGVFVARRSYDTPPDPFGGVIVDLWLSEAADELRGSARFWNYGGAPDGRRSSSNGV